MRPAAMRSSRMSRPVLKVARQIGSRPMSARMVSPLARTIVSRAAGTASRPNDAQSIVGGGTRLRAASGRGAYNVSPIRIAVPLPNPPRKRSRRALSGGAILTAPSPRVSEFDSTYSHLNTIRRCPGGRSVRGTATAGRGAPPSGGAAGGAQAERSAATAAMSTPLAGVPEQRKPLPDLDTLDPISLHDRVERRCDIHTEHAAEHRVPAVEVRLRRQRDEILASAGVGS